MKIKDQLHREIILEKIPLRIISLVPSHTETLFDLGLGDNIVGITKFCVHPKHLSSEKTIVGGTKKVNYKKIKDLQADLIIANKEENTENMVYELEEIAPTYVSNVFSIGDTLKFILDMGKLCDKLENAKKLVEEIENSLKNFKNNIEEYPARKVVYFIWTKPWMVVGGNNYINEILELNKFENIFDSADRYPEIYVEYLSDLNPELILLPSEPFPFKKSHIKELKEHLDAKFLLVDGEMFSWHGSRLLKALPYFESLHKILNN